MPVISYDVTISNRLSNEFALGFTSMSIDRLPHGPPIAIFLWHADGTGLKIQSLMHDIAERFEVGALKFSHAVKAASNVPTADLSDEFGLGLKASKLVLSSQGVSAESGVVLKGNSGSEIIIVAGAQPYTIAVKASFIAEVFDPEYELSAYSQEPIEG